MKKRYWDIPWYAKVWRHIYWAKFPYYVYRLMKGGMPVLMAMGISQGVVESEMEKTYTLQEVKEHIKHRINIRDK